MTSPLEQCRDALPLDCNESDPATLWAEIWRLRHESEGPGEYPTWKDAAIDERIKRVKAERAAAEAALAAQSEPVACVTECEACFTPDACQLRGKCDHYAAEQLRVKKAPLYAAPVAAPVAQPPEPDMRHPKIQRLIGAKARCEIELGLVEQLVEDPSFDATSMGMEYWGPLHDRLKAALEAAPVAQPPDEISPEFTDTARAALLWVLWHHQGGSSPIGQPLRFALGMDAHSSLNEWQIADAKRWAALTKSTTAEFRCAAPVAQPLPERFVLFALRDLKADRKRLDGFLALGNEVKRAAEYDEWIAALEAYCEAHGIAPSGGKR